MSSNSTTRKPGTLGPASRKMEAVAIDLRLSKILVYSGCMVPEQPRAILLHGGGPGNDGVIAETLAITGRHERLRRVTVVSTSAPGAIDLAVSRYDGLSQEFGIVLLDDPGVAMDPALAALVAAAEVVHLAGGSAPVIAALLRGTPIEAALRDTSLLVAESGGAMALGRWALSCPDHPTALTPGVGWFPTVALDTHFDAARAQRIGTLVNVQPTLFGVGLEGGTGFLVRYQPLHGRVLGTGAVHLVQRHRNALRTRRLTAGALPSQTEFLAALLAQPTRPAPPRRDAELPSAAAHATPGEPN